MRSTRFSISRRFKPSIKVGKISFFFTLAALAVSVLMLLLQLSDVLEGFYSKSYSRYDSHFYYNISFVTIRDLFSSSYSYIAYKLYPAYLIFVNDFLSLVFFTSKPVYQLFILANLLLYFVILRMFYVSYFKSNVLPLSVLGIVLFEPSLISFLLTLEREVVVSIFVGLFVISYLRICGVFWRFTCLTALLFVIASLRLEIFILVVVSWVGYRYYVSVRRNGSVVLKPLLLLFPLVALTGVFFQVDSMLESASRHLDLSGSKPGFGSLIYSLPSLLRLTLYSIFYFVMPVPIFGSKEYLYQYFLMFSGFSYSFFWSFIIFNIKNISSELVFPFILLILMHIGLGGTLFNIRHRTTIIVPLVILVLMLSKVVIEKHGYLFLRRQFRKSGCLAWAGIFGVNIVYYLVRGVF